MKYSVFSLYIVLLGLSILFFSSCNNDKPSSVVSDTISNIPTELQSLKLTSIFEDNFDAQNDFENPTGNYSCNTQDGSCSTIEGWTSLQVGNDRFHPVDDNDPNLEANFQLSMEQARGGTGKALKLYDESFGNSGQWGSDILLTKKFDQGYEDLYVEMWVKFQPNYRWHLLESGHGQNSAKILRIGHRQEGSFSSTFGSNGGYGPLTFTNIMAWASNNANEWTLLTGANRCAPQTTNYLCSDNGSGGIQGFIANDGGDRLGWAETFGDGQWHKIGMRMKLNSAPGITDGSLMIWYDDQLLGESRFIDWLGTDTMDSRLLNSVIVCGNMHNYPEPEANQFEQWYAIDDVRIFSVQ